MSPHQENPFVDRILEWYDSNGRHDLPWRAPDAAPFEVLVAELMLQKTSVGQVTSVYPEFIERYRTPDKIADAAETDLAEDLRPLGLSKRVGYFARACERILEEHDGQVPTDPSGLLELHGPFRARARSRRKQAGGGYER